MEEPEQGGEQEADWRSMRLRPPEERVDGSSETEGMDSQRTCCGELDEEDAEETTTKVFGERMSEDAPSARAEEELVELDMGMKDASPE